jgi:rhodanese-related sulfurtransferase
MTPDELPEIAIDEAMSRVEAGTLLLDVREQDEWDAGHAPDALFIPLSELGERLGEVPADAAVVVVCRSGMRSLRATGALRSHGVDAVSVTGGMQAWAAAGGELESTLPETPHIR